MTAHIFFVEPDSQARAEFESRLKGTKYVIFKQVRTIEQAVSLYPRLKPALVVLPIVTETMGGVEATMRIMEKDPDAKILITYDVSTTHLVREARRRGAVGLIKKPFHRHHVIERLALAEAGVESPYHSQPVAVLPRPVLVEWKPSRGFMARWSRGSSRKIGITGMYLVTDRTPREGTEVDLRVHTGEEEPLEMKGKVLRVSSSASGDIREVAVAYTDAKDDDKDTILHLVGKLVAYESS